MKTSLQWLSDFLPSSLAPQAAADALTHGGLPVENIETHGEDAVIDVEVTSNRGDCLSHVGVARELAALLDRPFKPLEISAPESATPAASLAAVRIDDLGLCPHYTARILRNVKIGPSPAWMVRRLEAVGIRPINNVVDVTNYVMFEMGQPLHAFDFDHLHGRQIIVRQAMLGEKITSIDGHERRLTPPMLVIADADRPVALAGVMGGLDSEVGPQTVNVLLESARFDPLSVRQTARTLAMKSESSYRFERRIDPLLPERASLRAAQLILEIAGGELLAGLVSAGQPGHQPRALCLRLARLKQVLGIDLPADVVVNALARLQLSPVLHGDRVEVTIPSWRLDLNIEVDLVEEVARVVGYDKIPVRDEIAIRLTPPEPAARATGTICDALVAGGYFEATTVSFVSDLLAGDFVPPEAHGVLRADPMTRKADGQLRPSILPGLLEAVRRNETVGNQGARFFEIGSTFWTDHSGNPHERRRLAFVGSTELREVRGMVEAVLNKLDAERAVTVIPDGRPGFAPGATGRVEWGGQPVGYVGRIDEKVAGKLSLRDVPAAAELDLEPLLSGAQHVPQQRPLPRFPAVRRDVSLVVADAVAYEKIDALIRAQGLPNLEGWEYVTTYRGKPLEKGTKSITTTLVFRSPSATLTGEQVEPAVEQLTAAAQSQLGATLRV